MEDFMPKNNEIKQRILNVADEKTSSVSELSRILNMNQVTVNNYMQGKRIMSLEFIVKFLEFCPEISAEWLIRGEGEMEKSPKESSIKPEESLVAHLMKVNEELVKQNSELLSKYQDLSEKFVNTLLSDKGVIG